MEEKKDKSNHEINRMNDSNPGLMLRQLQAIIDHKKAEREVLKESPAIALKILTLRFIAQGNFEKAQQFLEAAVKIDPKAFGDTVIELNGNQSQECTQLVTKMIQLEIKFHETTEESPHEKTLDTPSGGPLGPHNN